MSQPASEAPGLITLRQLCEVAEMEDEALQLLEDEQSPQEFLGVLVENEQYADAVRLLAHSLPTREAIWWAWATARRASGAEPPPDVGEALAVSERWITQPAEEYRRPALEIAERAKLSTPAGCVAFAVYFSGGSIAPPDVPEVPPPPFASSKAIAGAIILSAVVDEPEKAPAKFQAFINQGLDVARRVNLWPDTIAVTQLGGSEPR